MFARTKVSLSSSKEKALGSVVETNGAGAYYDFESMHSEKSIFR